MRPGRPSHATVVAYLALFIALASGTAVAAKKITADKLAKNAVTTKKIADGAVKTDKIANDAVTGVKIANGAVGENQIDSDAVTANKLAQNSVGTNKIRDEAVESGKLAAGAVTEGKIGNDAVVGSKVAAGSLDLSDYARAVVDIAPDPADPINAGTCELIEVPAPQLQTGDLPVLLWPAFEGDARLSAVAVTPTTSPGLSVLVCNYSGVNINAGPLPLKVALLR